MPEKDIRGKQAISGPVQSTNLARIGIAISALGDGIASIAEMLAIEDEEQSKMDSESIIQMEKQIDYLTNEVKQLKRMIR